MIKIGGYLSYEFRTFGGDLWVVPPLGGQARRVAQDANTPAWSPDGKKIAYVSGREGHRSILETMAEGGGSKPLLAGDASRWEIVQLQYSPNGAWICFATYDPERLTVIPAGGGAPRELTQGAYPVWDPSGRRIYYVTRNLRGGMRLQELDFDDVNGKPKGAPRTVGLMTGSLRELALSRDGRHLAVSELEGAMNLTLLPLTQDGGSPAGPEVPLTFGQVVDGRPSFSPDGMRIAYTSDRLGKQELWILDLESKRQERIQLGGEDVGVTGNRWFPDSRQLVVGRIFRSLTGLSYGVWRAAIDGSQSEEVLSPGLVPREFFLSLTEGPCSTSTGTPRRTRSSGWISPSRQIRQVTSGPGNKADPTMSPDGRFIAFTSDATGMQEVYRIPAGGGEPQVLDLRHRVGCGTFPFPPTAAGSTRSPATGTSGDFRPRAALFSG